MVPIFSVVVLTSMLVPSASATSSPILKVVSCTRSTLVVKVTDAAEDGLIYIQGHGENCKLSTSSSQKFYEFDFATCNIEWEMTFKVVLQKLKYFQTGDDQVVPIMCIADTSDISVGNFVSAGDKNDDNGLNKTVKPSAYMSFFKVVTMEDVSSKEVQLSDRLIMFLKLEDGYQFDFDIMAKTCVASGITLIEDYCAVDYDLFGNFWKMSQGSLMREFGAFRTTTLDSNSVMMNFTCTLTLCEGSCSPVMCPDGTYSGWGRKRRSADTLPSNETLPVDRKRRQTPYEDDTIDVGYTIEVVNKYSEMKKMTQDDFCWDKASFVALVTLLVMTIALVSSVAVYLYWRLRKSEAELEFFNNLPLKPTVEKYCKFRLSQKNSQSKLSSTPDSSDAEKSFNPV